MILDLVSAILGALLTVGAFSGLIVRDAMRPSKGRSSGGHKEL